MRLLAVVVLVASIAATAAAAPQCIGRGSGYQPLKQPFFGDLHTHTSYSLDAYTFGTRATPADAYAFATGTPISIGLGFDLGNGEQPGPFNVTIDFAGGRHLDFDAVTDHSEGLSTIWGCRYDPAGPAGAIWNDAYCQALRANVDPAPSDPFPCEGFSDGTATGCLGLQTSAWQATQQATEAANDPCTFTAFHGYEWTAIGDGIRDVTLHQNVIFRNAAVPSVPLDYLNYPTAPQMWAALSQACTRDGGCEAITIPHNPNLSDGRAFDIGGYGATDLNRLLKYRRLVEIHQHKGNSECSTDTDDAGAVTSCTFEIRPQPSQTRPRVYARDGLERGLGRFALRGYDPGKFGFVAATDNHNATSGNVDEASFPGFIGALDNTPQRRLTGESIFDNPGGITGVWAEENTRDAIFDALQRRETFGTSGPRIVVRFYQYAGVANPCGAAFPANVVQAGAVPMGGTMVDPGAPPQFVVHAFKDATDLAAVDIVKASVGPGGVDEKVYAIPLPPFDPLDPASCVTWTDPDWDPAEPAFWYARVRQQPTWRWSHYDCEALRATTDPCACYTDPPACTIPDLRDRQVEERAWTSPIWYLPGAPVTIGSDKLALRDGTAAGNPSARLLTFKAKTATAPAGHRVVVPAAGSAGDPTLHGATFALYNAETGETWTSPLPAAGWTAAGGGTRWSFSDPAGAIVKASVQNDRIAVKAVGAGLAFTLDEPRQGALTVRLALGTATPWCAQAPAKASGSGSTAANDRVGKFTGQPKAPAPDQCPLTASPSGAFLDDAGCP